MPMYQQKAQQIVKKHGLKGRPELVRDIANELRHVARFAMDADAPTRLAKLILDLTADSPEAVSCVHEGGIGYDLRLSQGSMADMIGASRSYVSTLINWWKAKGILTNIGRTTCVRNIQALRQMVAS